MKVKIIVNRSTLPPVGEVRDFEESYSLDLIAKGLAKAVDGKQTKKTVKKKTSTEGNSDGEEKRDS